MFTVAIIGRPNVGKSTLFNKLVGKKLALVHDTPGLTRDWREAEGRLRDLTFRVIDTAGLEESFDSSIEARMREKTEDALKMADMAFFVIDVRTGVTPMDRHFAEFLRKQPVKTVLLVNKCESEKAMAGIYEAHELGFGDPIPVSAEHGHGMSDLYDLLQPYVDAAAEEEAKTGDPDDEAFEAEEGAETGFGDLPAPPEDPEKPIRVAIVGRPNAGKSTLLNAILGENRSMTGPEAGITRDAVRADFTFGGRAMQLVDTAGLRKRTRVVEDIEQMSAQDSIRAMRLAHVVVLVLDAVQGFEKQDIVIAAHALREGRALVLAVNKWDAVKDRDEAMEEIERRLHASLSQGAGTPVVTLSALNNDKVDRVLKAVVDSYGLWNRRVPTGRLNRWLHAMESRQPAPMVDGRPNRLRYVTQVKARPPTFAIWVSRPAEFPESYERFLTNGLRKTFDLPAVPVRFIVKTSKNPYKD